jgi:2-keto-4-pentenoate hydratase
LIHPLVEPEIAIVLGCDIDGSALSRARLIAAVDAVMPALEIVETRYEQYEFAAVDNIADNSSAARFVVGEPLRTSRAGDLRELLAARCEAALFGNQDERLHEHPRCAHCP